MKKSTITSAILVTSLALSIQPAFASTSSFASPLETEKHALISDVQRLDSSVDAEIDEMIIEYQEKSTDTAYSPQQRVDSKEIAETLIQLRDRLQSSTPTTRSGNTGYDAAATAILAWFNARGYKLSAELFAHAMGNKAKGSAFSPTNGSRIRSSSVVTSINKNRNASGSAVFPNSGNTAQRDLYYAIHAFNWKTERGVFTLTDMYDFGKDNNYPSVQGFAVQIAYSMQQSGYIVPFLTVITY